MGAGRRRLSAEIESLYRFSCQLRTIASGNLMLESEQACTGLPPDGKGTPDETSDHRRHRAARGRDQGRGLLRPERPARRVGRDPGAHPGHRGRDRLRAQQRRPGLVRRAGRRLRPDHRPPGPHAGQRGLLHAAHLGHPGGTGAEPHHLAVHHGRGPGRRDPDVPHLVGAAQGGRRVPGRPAGTRPPDPRARGTQHARGGPRYAARVGQPARRLAGRPGRHRDRRRLPGRARSPAGRPGRRFRQVLALQAAHRLARPGGRRRRVSRRFRWPPTTPRSMAPRRRGTC